MKFRTKRLMDCSTWIYIPGMLFSIRNALTAMTVCRLMRIGDEVIIEDLETVHLKGHVNPVHISGKFGLIIDYVHNEVSIRSVLNTLRRYKRSIALYGWYVMWSIITFKRSILTFRNFKNFKMIPL